MKVRVLAIGFAVLAHVLVLLLLVIEHRVQRPEADAEQPQFVSLWLVPLPPRRPSIPATPSRLPSARAAPSVRATAPLVMPQEPAATLAPEPAPHPAAPGPAVMPPVDWASAAKQAADLYMANHGRQDTFSLPSDTDVPMKPCRPREISEAMQAKIDKLLGRPAHLPPPTAGPVGSVMMNGQRVGVLALPARPDKQAARRDSPDQVIGERRSSVPDPHTCD
jgi:hypothetical protein